MLSKEPTILPASLIPPASVPTWGLGASIVVNVPAASLKKPWSWLSVVDKKEPTIWPVLLIPEAVVLGAPGTSIAENAHAVAHREPAEPAPVSAKARAGRVAAGVAPPAGLA